MAMQLAMIYARSENHVIGKDGGLPWRLPEDFKHFKRTTLGHPIVMGRRTYEDHDSALPDRTNIVLTSRDDFSPPGIVVRQTLEDALEPYRATDETVFLIGGVKLLEQGYGIVDVVYETLVHTTVDGDAVLPAFDFSGWQTRTLMRHDADARHPHAFTVFVHRRS